MVQVAPGTIVVFSDSGCPWAHVACPTIVRDEAAIYDDLLRRAAG